MISTKGRYAVKVMIDLAEQQTDRPVPLDAIALRQGLSKKYLESIVKMLVAGKLLKGTSGKGGGYLLTRDPSEYNVYEILRLTEGSLATVSCLEDDAVKCPREESCRTFTMWRDYDEMVAKYFSGITIAELARNGE